MRLVDADALQDKAFGGRKGLVHSSDIDAVPTIDAIPVEWLKRKSLDANDSFSPYMMVMYEWYQEQKEQETKETGGLRDE